MNTYLVKIDCSDGKSVFRRFSEDRIIVGSSPFSSLHLPLKGEKAVHSLIQRKKNRFFITKLSLQSNLKVSGKDVFTHELQPDTDTISIEDYRLTIICPEKAKKIRPFEKTYHPVDEIDTANQDRKIGKGIIIGLAMTLLFLVTISFWKVPEEIALEDISERFSRLVIDPVANINPIAVSMYGTDGEGIGVKAGGPEGERGSEKAKVTVALKQRQIVRSKGVLGALRNRRIRRQLASILKDGMGFGKKFNKALERGVTRGTKIALYKGTFGSGLKGIGGGGGGKSKDIIGGLATKGIGGGKKGYGKGSIGIRVATSIVPDHVNTIIKGSLERSEIEKVIKNNLPQIRYCYERELKTNPELHGKIITFFIIGRDGQVTSSNIKGSTIKNAAVEMCVTRRIADWIFPKPRGGGMVVVKYPFLFSSTESIQN